MALLQHCKVKKSSYGHQFSSVSSRYNDENSRCGAVTVSDFNPVKAGDSHTEAPTRCQEGSVYEIHQCMKVYTFFFMSTA